MAEHPQPVAVRRGPPWRRWSLRVRLLVLALAGVALVQALGSIALVVALSYSGNRAIDASARATATEVAGLVRAGRVPATLPVTGSEVVQVLDEQGRVLSASANADRLTAVLDAEEVRRAVTEPVTVSGSRLGVSSRLRTQVVEVTDPGGARVRVLVAEPVDELTRGEDLLPTLLVVSYPLLLAVLGLIAWRMIGAALRPVEQLRTSAERISGSPGREERLPLPAADDELRALALTLNSMLDRVSAARERERGLVADVAHELRSPLASMRMQVDVSRRTGRAAGGDDGWDASGDDGWDDLDVEVTRMSRLVDDLLVLARLDHATSDPASAERAGPAGGRASVASVLAAAVRGRDAVALGDVVDADAAPAPDDLARVVGNLVDNAVRHARSRVEVSAHLEDTTGDEQPWLVVRIDDDGAGVPAADRERVFERFVRLDEARDRDSGGSGLGLAIARGLAHGWGGDVRLADASGGGLRAEVLLPTTS